MNSLRFDAGQLLGLVWKESRLALRMVLIFVAGTFVVFAASSPNPFENGPASWRGFREFAAVFAFCIPLLAAAMAGAHAFAVERVWSTDLVLEALPVRRLTRVLIKVVVNFAFLVFVDAVVWFALVRNGLADFAVKEPFTVMEAAMVAQVLIFGLSHLCSSLSEKPLRALFVAPLILLFTLVLVLAGGISLFILAAGRELADQSSLSGYQVFLESSTGIGLLLILLWPFLFQRWHTRPRLLRHLRLMAVIPFLLLSLPLLQLWRVWGLKALGELIFQAYDFDADIVIWMMVSAGAAMLFSAIYIENRRWVSQGIGAGWSGVFGVAWTTGSCLVACWVVMALGMLGRFPLRIGEHCNLYSAQNREQQLALRSRVRGFSGTSFQLPFLRQGDAVHFREGSSDAVLLPIDLYSGGSWSPDFKTFAWSQRMGDLFSRRVSLGIYETDAQRLQRVTLPQIDFQDVNAASTVIPFWSPDSKQMFCVVHQLVESRNGPDLMRAELTLFEIEGLGITFHPRLITRWTSEASEMAWYAPYPTGAAVDGKDLLIFLEPRSHEWRKAVRETVPAYPSPRSLAYGLFRFNSKTGAARPDPAFESLRKDVAARTDPSARTSFNWKRDPWNPWAQTDPQMVHVMSYVLNNDSSWLEAWRLGVDGRANERVIHTDHRSRYVIIDDRTQIIATWRDLNEDDNWAWEVMKRDLTTGEEDLLLSIPKAHSVYLVASPSGRRLVVGTHRKIGESDYRSESWLLATDGSFAHHVPNVHLSTQTANTWTSDESACYWWQKDGLYVAEFRSDPAGCTIRPVLLKSEHPEYRHWRESFSSVGKSSMFFMTDGYRPNGRLVSRFGRIDLATGKPEVLFRYSGGQWIGTKAVSIKEVTID
ncbi:MAG: hypothetical protein QGF00_12850 [Planctomycetota bacterium]|nr:hypothetical protein [Planctomycetota bacterium]